MRFEKHIFICTNQREDASKSCCGEGRGMELVKIFKKKLKEKGLHTQMRAQRAGCIDACNFGPAMVVYPEGVFYGGVTPEDIDEIISSHLVNETPVERLIIDFNAQ